MPQPFGDGLKWLKHCGFGRYDPVVVVSYYRGYMPAKYWLIVFSVRPRSAEYTIGICFETSKNTKAFEWLFTGFQHSLWNFSTTENLYSLKSWMWLATVACVVCWTIINALLNDIWLTCFTRMCNWNYRHKGLWSTRSLVISTLVNSHLLIGQFDPWSIRTSIVPKSTRSLVLFAPFSCNKRN